MKRFGIDISKWQKGINLAQAKAAGVEFIILKAGGSDNGKYKDACFDSFYLQAKALNIPIGAYYFGRDLTVADARASAEHFINLLSDKQFEYPVYYDVEGKMLSLSKYNLTEVVKTFCETVEEAGYWTGIYASASTFKSEVSDEDLKHFCHWVAAWNKTKPNLPYSEGDMWQFGGETNRLRDVHIAGYVVDQDYCFKDYPTLIRERELNNLTKQTEPGLYVADEPLYHVVITATALNVRSGPNSIKYGIVETLKRGAECPVYEVNGKWGRIGEGWICLNYTKKK